MELQTRVYANVLREWAKDKPEVLVLSADLTSPTECDLFHEAYPDRFFSMGMAEQNMMGFAGGLAREGFYPFVHTFGVFIARRAYDQISMSIAHPNLPVRLMGFLPGLTTPGGATHQAIEDIASMRAMPNITVLECGDATDTETVLDVAHATDGPVYVRMLRGEIPRLFARNEPMRLGSARLLSRGADIALLSSGICTEEALRATQALAGKGVSIQHLHISTLKPFCDPSVLAAAARARYGVITIENHSIIGGLGSAVAEVMAEEGLNKKLVRLGLKDRYSHGGSRRYLMHESGMDAIALVQHVEKLLGQSLGITEEDLQAIDIAPVNSHGVSDAL